MACLNPGCGFGIYLLVFARTSFYRFLSAGCLAKNQKSEQIISILQLGFQKPPSKLRPVVSATTTLETEV
jgi:hypothetical protein